MTDVCHQLKDILILFEAFHLSYPLVAYFPMCMKSLAYIHLHLPIILTFASLVPIAIVSSILSESYQRTHESKDGVKSVAKNAPSKVAYDGNLILLWFIAWTKSRQFFYALVGRSGFKSFLLHLLPDLWNWYGISGAQISCASDIYRLGVLPFWVILLIELQKEKNDRLHQVLEFMSTIHDLYDVLRMDFFSIVVDVHPGLNDSTIVQSEGFTNDTLSRMAKTVSALKEDKK